MRTMPVSLRSRPADLSMQVGQLAVDPFAGADHDLPRRREGQPGARALEEAHAHRALERSDAPRQRRGMDAEGACCAAHRAVTGRRPRTAAGRSRASRCNDATPPRITATSAAIQRLQECASGRVAALGKASEVEGRRDPKGALMGQLEGRVAVITGGSSGIGLATAERMRAEGAKVVLFARDEKALATAARTLGGDVLAVAGDVRKNEDLDRLYETATSRHGAIDVLFANAGIAEWVLAAEVTPDHYDRMFDVNTRGVFFTVQRALPHLRQGSTVVLNTSVADCVGAKRTSVYAASKAAVRSFARTLAAELLPRGIRVNAVSPGPTETPIQAKAAEGLSAEVLQEMGKATMSRIPLGRLAKPREKSPRRSSSSPPRRRRSSWVKSSPSTVG